MPTAQFDCIYPYQMLQPADARLVVQFYRAKRRAGTPVLHARFMVDSMTVTLLAHYPLKDMPAEYHESGGYAYTAEDDALFCGLLPGQYDEVDFLPYDSAVRREVFGVLRTQQSCPLHGKQDVVSTSVTRGPDPYGVDNLACGHAVICVGPGEPNTIISNRPYRNHEGN